MSNNKIVIICLILLMAIFVVALSLNLVEKPNQGITSKSSDEQKQQTAASLKEKSGWLKAVDGLLSPFATSLTLKEVSISCSQTHRGFYLSEQTPICKISVPGFNDKAFKKLSLKPNNPAIRLEITYQIDDQEEKISWPAANGSADNVDFVILGKEELQGQIAAVITLKCINCSNQKNAEIVFE